ncbi:response regulator transcription factor [Rhodospirillum sp. A1_3_36]|uniref:response regulator transcription factor n=1 Tax=Rhodospirillum sp. A1_3_36 TaxID=3391666 RepID=UPI0039A55326
MTMAIRVLLVDDHPLVVEGIHARLETESDITVVGEAFDGLAALSLIETVQADIVLMDINMPKLNGIDTMERMRREHPDLKVLVLSMHDNREYIANVLRAGARGYVLKDVPSREIVTAIRAVHRGGSYFSGRVSEQLLDLDRSDNGPLTNREQTILHMLAEGLSNKDIARDLDLSVRTVETHRTNIKRKLGIDSTAGLTRYAMSRGLVK